MSTPADRRTKIQQRADEHVQPSTSNTDLGSAEAIVDSATALNAMQDAPGLSITVKVSDRPILVEALLQMKHSNAGGIIVAEIFQVTGVNKAIFQGYWQASANNALGMLKLEKRLPLAPGTYTFKVRFCTFAFGTAGTSHLNGGPDNPNSLRAMEI